MFYHLARILFASLFVFSGMKHFLHRESVVRIVAEQGIWIPEVAHMIAAGLCLAGGVLLFLNQVKWGLYCIWLFLVPTTVLMHQFWTLDDFVSVQNQLIQFLKNLSILGGSLFIYMYQREIESKH